MDNIYPEHIYDPFRRRIAAELIQHEFRKLFRAVPESLWPQIDANIEGWFDGTAYELAPVHDFWNAADGIMRGFKLKRLIAYITAENLSWTLQDIPVSEIDLQWALEPLKRFGEPPYDTRIIHQALQDDASFARLVREDSDMHATSSVGRDHFPIIAMLQDSGRYAVADGNRRSLRALIYERPHIQAWVMTGDHMRPHNYWVSSGFMREIGDTAAQARTIGNPAGVQAIKTVLRNIFAQSDIARINYDARVADKFAWLEL